jgi:hypothetical protein
LSARPSTEGQLVKTAPTPITFVTAAVYNIAIIGNFIVYFKRKCLKISLIKIKNLNS